jgi:hypothetical protein
MPATRRNQRQSDDDPSHHLFVTEAPDRRQERSDGQRAAETPRTGQRPSDAPRSGFAGQRVPDHQAPLQRDGPAPARDVLDDVPEWAR